jgi:hypothetical protein
MEENARISPWNFLDQLRLLWWAIATPHQIHHYREDLGEANIRRVGKRLVSTLLWLPFLILALSLALDQVTGELPPDGYPLSGLILILVLFLFWLFSGWLPEILLEYLIAAVLGFSFCGTSFAICASIIPTPNQEGAFPQPIVFIGVPVALFFAVYFIFLVMSSYYLGSFFKKNLRDSEGEISSSTRWITTGLAFIAYLFLIWVSFLRR